MVEDEGGHDGDGEDVPALVDDGLGLLVLQTDHVLTVNLQ